MTADQAIVFVALPLAGYFLGSIPFAWVIGKSKGVDIRTVGSKNIGATNLGRTLGPRFFWYAFLLDAAKGFFPILTAALLVNSINKSGGMLVPFPDDSQNPLAPQTLHPILAVKRVLLPMWSPLLTGIACVTGHLLPVYLKFKGGKGVATGFGVVLGFWPVYTLAGLAGGLFFVFMLMVYRYISLASMTASVLFAAVVAWLTCWHNPYLPTYCEPADRWPLIGVAALFSLLIIWRHRTNIARLLRGTEPTVKIGGGRPEEKS